MLSNLAKAMPASRHLLFFVGFLLIIPMGCGGSSGGSSSPQLPGASQAPITAEVQMNQGLLAGIFLRQNSDQRYLLRAFPRGLEFAANAGAPQEVGLPVLRKLLKAESEKEA